MTHRENRNLALIMAGGQGTRFWPYSTARKPKQFLQVVGTERLITQTYRRVENFLPRENIYIVADSCYLDLIRESIPGFDRDHLIAEPAPRNTAPCMILANVVLQEKWGEAANLLVMPADHYITEEKIFARQMSAAFRYAKHPGIITFGIPPHCPHTGYGYIRFDPGVWDTLGEEDFYPVREFTEKPELNRARKYIADGGYLWNAGIFVYRLGIFHEMLSRYAPYYAEKYRELEKAGGGDSLNGIYRGIKPQSIDYALLEKAREIRVCKAKYFWNDVGAWSSVYELEKKDRRGNVNRGEKTVFLETQNSLVFSTQDKPIALIGLENIAVINTENGILVSDLGQVQKIREVLKKI